MPKDGSVPAVEDLQQYLRDSGESLSEFAARAGVVRVELSRTLRGYRVRVSVDFASLVEAATDGAVPISRWARAREAILAMREDRGKMRREALRRRRIALSSP